APTTPPPPVRITEIIGWPKWGSAAVVMMLAWSTCEPPNGYGVTNCSSLSGDALAALVSAKAAAAGVASEAIDRRGGRGLRGRARDASGHGAAAPPSAASNSRRPMVTVIRPPARGA